MKPITVRELIAQLETMPPDAFVHTEGCDCVGPCSGARMADPRREYAGTVVLTRDDTREANSPDA